MTIHQQLEAIRERQKQFAELFGESEPQAEDVTVTRLMQVVEVQAEALGHIKKHQAMVMKGELRMSATYRIADDAEAKATAILKGEY